MSEDDDKMKTMEEILKQKAVYVVWKNKENVMDSFVLSKEERDVYQDSVIVFAVYDCDEFSGTAFVLFEQDGRLYEVHGGHCSYDGLENQWLPEEVDLNELEHRLIHGTFGENSGFKKDLCNFLGVKFKQNRMVS